MECPGSDRIAAYVDGRVDVSEEVLLLEHCSECDDCRRELALSVKLRKEPSEPMPSEIRARVLKALDRERLPRTPRSLRRERTPGYGRVAAAAALLLVAGVLMLVSLKPWERPRAEPIAETNPVVSPEPAVPEPEPADPEPEEAPAPARPRPKPAETPSAPAVAPPKPRAPQPLRVSEVREPEPKPGEPLPVEPGPGKTRVEDPRPAAHTIATRTFSELELSDFNGTLTVRREGARRTEKLSGVARLSEGDVVTAKTPSSFHVQGRHPVVLSAEASVSMAYVPEEQAPYLRLHSGEAIVDSTDLTRWIVSDGTVAVVVKQARARFAAIPKEKGLAVMALSEPLYVQPDGGKVYPVSVGQELRVAKERADVNALRPDEARRKSALFDSARPREKTIFYTSCDPQDARRDHFFVQEGSFFNDIALLSRTGKDRLATVMVRPNPRFAWSRGLVLRFRIRTNAQKIQVVMPVADRRFSFVKTVTLKRSELNRWAPVELPFADFTWRDEGGAPRIIYSTDKFNALRFEARQRDVFGDQPIAFLVDDLQVVKKD